MQKNNEKENRELVLEKLATLGGVTGTFIAIFQLSPACNLSEGDTKRHIDYWTEKGCVKPTNRVSSVANSYYKLTAKGIDYLDGNNNNQSTVVQTVNITNSQTGHIQGTGTITGDAYNAQNFFTKMEEAITESDFTEEEKKSALKKLKDFSSHPIFTSAVTTVLQKIFM